MKTHNQLNKVVLALIVATGLFVSSYAKGNAGNNISKQMPQGKADVVCTNPDVQPKFSGDLSSYLQTHISYPASAKKNKISGTVYVSFLVAADGTVKNAKILKSADGSLNAEAMRVVNNMPKWIPGQKDGKNVSIQFNLPIKFELK